MRPIAERTAELAILHARIFGSASATTRIDELAALGVDPNDQRGKENITEADLPRKFSDVEILTFAPNAANGEKFLTLWRGDDLSVYGGDHSAADLALVSILMFWTRGDRQQADRLFRLSGLVRSKWTNRADYRERTFNKVTRDAL